MKNNINENKLASYEDSFIYVRSQHKTHSKYVCISTYCSISKTFKVQSIRRGGGGFGFVCVQSRESNMSHLGGVIQIIAEEQSFIKIMILTV